LLWKTPASMPQSAAPDLSDLSLFASLPPEALQRLQGLLERCEIPADQEFLKLGAKGDLFAIVERGLICLEDADCAVRMACPGGSFGEAMLRYGVPSTFSARTLTPAVLWTLTHKDWLALRQSLPASPENKQSHPKQNSPAKQTSQTPVASPPPTTTPVVAGRSGARWAAWLLLLFLTLALVFFFLGPQVVTAGSGWLALEAIDAQRPEEAASTLRLALTVQPESASLHDSYGYLLFRLGRLEEAQTEFEHALRIDPELASALNNLGVTLLAVDQPVEGLRKLEMASALDPGDPDLQNNLGEAYSANNNLKAAMAAYQRAFTLDPTQLAARSRWASLALQLGDFEGARQAWLQVVAANPQDAQAQLGLGVIAWREGRPAAAAQHLKSASQADPTDPLVRLYLGLVFTAVGQPENAVAEFERALMLSPDPAVQKLAQDNLAVIHQAVSPAGQLQNAGVEGGEPLPTP
jgi:tetratricopeptide (TPR) repeat protein